MVDRVLAVRLRMEVDDARRAAKQVAQDLRGIGGAAEGSGKASTAAMSGIAGAARSAGKAVAVVGTVAATGLAAVTASTIKGGLAYNRLEQTSRAALTTVLGSATAASSQMQKLREFGKTSPFPRQVWISAQQQLLAFGMSAEKIIPTFKAVQDAVAAAGGGGQQISEVVEILAQVQSTGKVTAETLNELGVRGIDAATLIGDAMGKTAQEVRDDISAQAISGVQFIDQLTGAMTLRFGGAAANVKKTWAGAIDRVKGAVRDIGGLLASPLVDPNGGGAAVEWANGLADALRALEQRLGPIVESFRTRAEPAVKAFGDKLQDLAVWIRDVDLSGLAAEVRSMLPAVAGLGAGLVTMGAKSIPVLDRLVGETKLLPVALAAAALASPELRAALADLLRAAAPLIDVVGQTASLLASSLGPVLSLVAALLQPVIQVVSLFSKGLEMLPGPIQAVVGALILFKGLQMAGVLGGITTAFQSFGSEILAQKRYAAMAGEQVSTLGATFAATSSKVQRASRAIGGVRGALSSAVGILGGPWGAAIGLGITALGVFSASQQDAKDATESFTVELDRQTGALSGASIESIYKWAAGAETLTNNGAHLKDVLADFGLTARDLTGYLTGNAEATEKVNRALSSHDSVAERNSFQQFLDLTKGQLDEQERALRDGAAASDAFSSSQGGAANALSATGGAATDASTRLQQLRADLQLVYDAQFGLGEAQDEFQSGLHKLRNAFAQNDTAASKSAASGTKYSDALKRQQRIVRDTAKQLSDLAEAQRDAEREAAEAARAAKQRTLDELFGRQFDVQSTVDAFRSGLAQAGADVQSAVEGGTSGALSLGGFSEGALGNRERMRGLVQQAQAAIQAEIDRGASKGRVQAVTKDLSAQLATQAKSWGLNAKEVKSYTDAIVAFGGVANRDVRVDLASVRKEFAEQRQEIKQNSAEQMENARQSAASATAARGAATATKIHTAALVGNSESAIENRAMMRNQVKAAQEELTQMALNGASKEALTARGAELAAQLEQEALKMGFAKRDMSQYTDTIRDSAVVINQYPTLNVRAITAGALTTIKNFVKGVNAQLAKIDKNFLIGIRTGSEYVNTLGGGHVFAADGGFIRGPGGPREDKIPAMLSNGEYVVNAKGTQRARPLLEAINSGREVPIPTFALGGEVGKVDPVTIRYEASYAADTFRRLGAALGVGSALQWAASQAGKPYIWGGVGPAGYDCSGFMSAITNVLQHKNPYSRRFATGNFPTGDFDRGAGNFMIGSRRGNPGHMAGTLNGVNVESRGSDGVVVGRRARGARDSLFGGNVWRLKGYADGGMVQGDPPFDIISPLGKHFDRLLGSFEGGTSYVPMDGPYQLHRGEAVIPHDLNRALTDALRSGRLGGTHNENHIEVKSFTDRYDHRQVMDDLALRGVA